MIYKSMRWIFFFYFVEIFLTQLYLITLYVDKSLYTYNTIHTFLVMGFFFFFGDSGVEAGWAKKPFLLFAF